MLLKTLLFVTSWSLAASFRSVLSDLTTLEADAASNVSLGTGQVDREAFHSLASEVTEVPSNAVQPQDSAVVLQVRVSTTGNRLIPLACTCAFLASIYVVGFILSMVLPVLDPQDENHEQKEWQLRRTEGYLCNSTVIVGVLGVFTWNYHILQPYLIPSRAVFLAMASLYACDCVRNFVSLQFQYLFYCKFFGMSEEDRELVVNRRDIWSQGKEVDMLVNRYGLRPVKIMDATNRRFGHIFHFGIHTAFFWNAPSSAFIFQLHILLTMWRVFVHHAMEFNNVLGRYDYSGARMRDGKFGRFNLLVVAYWGGSSKFLTIALFIVYGITDYSRLRIILILAVQPVVWGDTAGEVIGSFFGRLQFTVYGFGEKNKKTLEGCAACWTASFVGLYAVLQYADAHKTAVDFSLPRLLVVIIIASVGTLAETLSLRGTDNFFIFLGSASTILLLIKPRTIAGMSDVPTREFQFDEWHPLYFYMTIVAILVFASLHSIQSTLSIHSLGSRGNHVTQAQTLLPQAESASDELPLLWGNTTLEASPEVRMESVLAAAPPNKLAIMSWDGKTLTYAELEELADCLAHNLRAALPQTSGMRCGLQCERSTELIVSMFGILKAGAAYVPLASAIPDDRLLYILEDSGAGCVLCEAQHHGRLSRLGPSLPIFDLTRLLKQPDGPRAEVSQPLRADDTMVIFYTSGSTGKPKGVELSHRAEATAAFQHAQRWVRFDDKVLNQVPFNFDVSITEIFGTFAAKATLVLASPSQHDIAALHEVFTTLEPDVVTMVPSLLSVYKSTYGIPTCRYIGLGGEALPVDLWNELHSDSVQHEVVNLYGPTEVAVASTFFGPDPMAGVVSQCGQVPIGQPYKWRECFVMSHIDAVEACHLLPVGAEGELWLAGDGLAKGYVNLPETTSQVFKQHPLCADRVAYRTGDLVRWHQSGDLLYLGRIDTQVKLHGMRIELEEIESILRAVPGVTEAAVVVHRDGGQQLVAYVSPGTASIEAARSACAAKLPLYMVPPALVSLESWPRLSSGKIDRRALAMRELPSASLGSNDEPQDMVMGMDSLMQMRMFSSKLVAERDQLTSLVGYSIFFMCINHFDKVTRKGLEIAHSPATQMHLDYGFFAVITNPLFADLLFACAAFTEARARAVDGTSTTFRFTWREPMLLLAWVFWSCPVPQLIGTVEIALSGAPAPPHWNLMAEKAAGYGLRSFLLLLVVMKAFTVACDFLHVAAPAQLGILGVSSVLSCLAGLPMRLGDWYPLRLGFPVYCLYLFHYVITVNYGPTIVGRCAEFVGDRMWLKSISVPVAMLCLIGLRIAMGHPIQDASLHLWFYPCLALLLAPLTSLLAVAALPSNAICRFIGRYALGTFLTHRFLMWTVCVTPGMVFQGYQLIPPAGVAAARLALWTGAEGRFAVSACTQTVVALYSLSFCCTIGPLFQLVIFRCMGLLQGLPHLWGSEKLAG